MKDYLPQHQSQEEIAMDKIKTVVRIDDREYVLAGHESESYMHEVAIFVDKKMREVHSVCESLNTSMTAVLTAVNLADELIKERRKSAELERQVRELFANKTASNKKKIASMQRNL